jgi:ectoine hydroxylase-related dioxygenase (phytanoyl-CoA dioxygenase family)
LKGKECFQAMVPLVEVIKEVGGLQVVPKSHLAENKEKWQKNNEWY